MDANPFDSASALREANRLLVEKLHTFGEDFPASFLGELEYFQRRTAATGAYLSALEDRSEAQSLINFWQTILFNGGRRPETIILAEFDMEAARARAGGSPPYKGLEAFQIVDCAAFFGRATVVREMLDRLATHRLLAVTGLSGSGKSSVVRAGLIPRLREGELPGSREWRVADPVVPGRDPIGALSELAEQCGGARGRLAAPSALVAALDRGGAPALISVDQFEELFTVCDNDEDRRFTLDALTLAATGGAFRHIVIVTMRSEFDSRVETHPAFAALFAAGRIQIGALSAHELRSAIEEPANQVGVAFEPGLPEELVQRVLGEPAGLPLLQFTLLELWKRRSADNKITWAAYTDPELGGSPREILARRANQVYESFATNQDRIFSERIFLALAEIGSGLEPTARRVTREELDRIGTRDSLDYVLRVWQENGLVRISPPPDPDAPIAPDSQVEVAHEALIRNWERLVGWIEDHFATTRRRRVLTERARAWWEGKGELLGELSLMEAETYESLTDNERDYVTASQAGVELARRKMRRRNRIALLGSVAMAILTIAATVSSIAALNSYNRALQEGEEAEEARGAAQASAYRARRAEEQASQSREYALRQVREAQNRLIAANRQLAELRIQEARTRRALREALTQRTAVRTTTLAERADLARIRSEEAEVQARIEGLQTQVRLAEERLRLREEQLRLAEGQIEGARNVSQQVVAAIGRSDVTVSTAARQQPASIRTVAERLQANLTARRGRAPLGLPEAPLIVDRRIYTVGFDPAILSPRWVAFTVDARSTLQLRRLPLEWSFDPDIPRPWQTGEDAYRNNSYDRGHLVRRADALIGPTEADARASEVEINYYSVTVPQADQTNRTTWAAVEQYTTELSARLGPIYVVAGPVYPDLTVGSSAYLTLGSSRTAVPLYLYRVLLRRDARGRWRALAFLVPNDFSSSRDALQFVTSVSEVERLTGLRFFSGLPAAEATTLKSNLSPADFEGSAAN